MTTTESGDAEFWILTDELQDTRPDCEDDDRFIADDPTLDERVELASICSACAVAAACEAYARAAKPRAGFWAGALYGRRGRR